MESDAIPMEIFSNGGSELGQALSAIAESLLKLTKGIAEASRFSLLQSDLEVNTLSLHRLAQEVLIAEMDGPARKTWAERAVRAVNAAFPSVEFSNWKICGFLVTHAQKLAGTIESEGFEFEQASRLLNQTGSYLYERAQYAEAEPLMRRALKIDEQSFGLEHHRVGLQLNNLAQLLKDTNRMAEAEPLMRRAVTIFENSLGSDHPNTRIVRGNYALLLQDKERKGR